MTLVRKIISLIVGSFAFIGIIIGLLYALIVDNSMARTIEHSRLIEASFWKAVTFIEIQEKEKGRLPTSSEFEKWASKYPRRPYTPNGIRFIDSEFPKDAIKEFGDPPSGSYLLAYWRGEWEEYFASWVQKSTLIFDPKRYHMLGSKIADSAVVVLICVLFLFLAVKLWPKKFRMDTPNDNVSYG